MYLQRYIMCVTAGVDQHAHAPRKADSDIRRPRSIQATRLCMCGRVAQSECRYLGLLQGFSAAEKQIDRQHCQYKRLLKVQADLRADFAHALGPVGNLSVDLSREYIRHVIGKRRCCSLLRQFKRVSAWYCDAGGATRVWQVQRCL